MDNTFNIIECIKSNAITLIVAIYLIVIAYYMTKDPEKLFTKIYLYTTVAVVPIVIGVIYALNNTGSSEKSEFKNRLSTALPNDPVPPVIIKVLFLNIIKFYFSIFNN